MSKWLPKDEPNKLPHFASHFVGAGGNILLKNKGVNDFLGVVIREETNEILVIQEKISTVGSKNKRKKKGIIMNDNRFMEDSRRTC